MTQIKKIYNGFVQEEINALGEIKEVNDAYEKTAGFLKQFLDDDAFMTADALLGEISSASETQGFIYGFRNAVRLMAECTVNVKD